ncbi:MAG: protein-glutamate O-methyltransferase CheR [Peptococcaceae bacterium]|nr:protein-glutamate O-methyltransferase CheR [Peptococcaceae bacterium]
MANTAEYTYEDFIKQFYPKSGLDLHYYKQTQMQRRIESFMRTRSFNGYREFLQALNSDAELFDAFFKHLTINVSQFFRDASQWDVLVKQVLPLIVQGKTRLKLWSAGCSSGQEPYSLAIMMREHFPSVSASILATDIDKNILKQAQAGVYRAGDFSSTPPNLLNKYFIAQNNAYQVRPEIQQMVTFQAQNLLTDRFGNDFDFIACRNVVIYFTDDAKAMLYQKFANALRSGGVFFTGSTERCFGTSDYGLHSVFTFFYQKR